MYPILNAMLLVATVVFAVLKLAGLFLAPWWVVFMPLLVAMALFLILFVFMLWAAGGN